MMGQLKGKPHQKGTILQGGNMAFCVSNDIPSAKKSAGTIAQGAGCN